MKLFIDDNRSFEHMCALVGIKDMRTDKNACGKPYLISGEAFFNISHSGGIFICVFSDSEVGADVQVKSGRFAEGVKRRFFSESEQIYANTPDQFYEVFCAKESYAKYLGKGISAFTSINVVNGGKICAKKACIQRIDIFEHAFCFVTTAHEEKIEVIDLRGKHGEINA